MPYALNRIFTCVAIMSLSACGGSEGGDRLIFTKGPDAPAFDTGTGIISVDGRLIARSNDNDFARRGNARVALSNEARAITAQTGAGNTYAIVYRESVDGTDPEGAIYGRLAVPDLPPGGTVLEGNYAGFLTPAEALIFPGAVTGRATLTVSFDGDEISGGITERQFDGRTGADVFFQSADLSDDGRFSGRAVGGSLPSEGGTPTNSIPSNGRFEGILAGPSGTEAVGIFSLDHRTPGIATGNIEERGVFSANR